MKIADFIYLVRSDLFRYTGKVNSALFLKTLLFSPGFRYNLVMRFCRYSRNKVILFPVYVFAYMLYWHLTYKYGIWVDFNADIGPGFYIGHFGGIFISEEVKIGRNCNISQGIVIGKRNRGEKKGCPVLGDKVYVGAGAKIIGKIKIGNNVAIGVNSVVVDDIPDNSVVVGIPGKVISSKGSEDYVDNLI